MGKGSRNSQKRAQDKVLNSEKYLEQEKKQTKKSRTDKVIAVVCVVFALLIAAVLVLNVMSESGVFMRANAVIESANVKVDETMMSFFLNDYIMGWMNEYSIYVQYGLLSLDMTRSYHNQYLTSQDASYLGSQYVGYTWYDYFLSVVQKDVEKYVVYAEAAKAAGVTLDAEDYETVDEAMEVYNDSLSASNAGYSDWYGKGVKEKDVRRCQELMVLAQKYSDQLREEFEAALEEDDAPVFTYRDDNKSAFYTAEVLTYDISLTSKGFTSDADYDNKVKEAKAAADKIANAKSPEEFVSLVDEYEATVESETLPDIKPETEEETLSPEEELESKLEEYKEVIPYNYNDETETGTDTEAEIDEVDEWLFNDENPAKVGDVKVVEETGTKTETVKEDETVEESETGSESEGEKSNTVTYDTYTVTVYYVVKANGLDESLTKDYAYLISNNKEAFDAFVESIKAESALDREKFKEIADEAYEALHDSHDHDEEGFVEPIFGAENVDKAADEYFLADYDAMNKYLDAGDLKENTLSDVITMEIKDETYYAIVFFEGYNDMVWYAQAYEGVVSENYTEWYESHKKEYALKFNDDALSDLNTIMWSTGSSDGHDH